MVKVAPETVNINTFPGPRLRLPPALEEGEGGGVWGGGVLLSLLFVLMRAWDPSAVLAVDCRAGKGEGGPPPNGPDPVPHHSQLLIVIGRAALGGDHRHQRRVRGRQGRHLGLDAVRLDAAEHGAVVGAAGATGGGVIAVAVQPRQWTGAEGGGRWGPSLRLPPPLQGSGGGGCTQHPKGPQGRRVWSGGGEGGGGVTPGRAALCSGRRPSASRPFPLSVPCPPLPPSAAVPIGLSAPHALPPPAWPILITPPYTRPFPWEVVPTRHWGGGGGRCLSGGERGGGGPGEGGRGSRGGGEGV